MKGNFIERKDGKAVYTAKFEAGDYDYLEAMAMFDEIHESNKHQYKSIKGKTFIIKTTEDERYKDTDKIHLIEDNGEGIEGNSNPNIKCYHGWRGTWNTTAIHACGLRTVESAKLIEGDRNHISKIRIVFGKDLAKDKE